MNWRLTVRTTAILVLLAWLIGCTPGSRAQRLPETALTNLTFDQKLNTQVSLDLTFQNESGGNLRLGDYFGRRPAILVLGYYECPMLCHLVLNGLVESLQNLKATVGKDFEVVCLSIDPSEAPELAAAKKRTYLQRYGRPGAAAGWHFLTGQDAQIRQLASEVGFHYAYDPSVKQYAHPSGLVVLTPQGQVSRYFFGVSYAPQDLNTALIEASRNQIGTPARTLLMLCFRYMGLTGKHSGQILWAVRLIALATLLALTAYIVRSVRQEKSARSSASAMAAEVPQKGSPL